MVRQTDAYIITRILEYSFNYQIITTVEWRCLITLIQTSWLSNSNIVIEIISRIESYISCCFKMHRMPLHLSINESGKKNICFPYRFHGKNKSKVRNGCFITQKVLVNCSNAIRLTISISNVWRLTKDSSF